MHFDWLPILGPIYSSFLIILWPSQIPKYWLLIKDGFIMDYWSFQGHYQQEHTAIPDT